MIEVIDIPKMKLADIKWSEIYYDIFVQTVEFIKESQPNNVIKFDEIPFGNIRDYIQLVYEIGIDFELGQCDNKDNMDMYSHFETFGKTFSITGDGYYGGVTLSRIK
jgi:hypothetical protein